jgi:hypothetical protein
MKITRKKTSLFITLIITFFVLTASSEIFAKDGFNIQAEVHKLKEYRFHSMARRFDKEICELSMIYEVPYTNIVSILSRQYFHYGFEDSMQDIFIGSGRYFNQADLRRLNKEYNAHSKQDRKNVLKGKKNESRNSADSYLFSSLGPAQIQIYMGMKLIKLFPSLNYIDINEIAHALSSKLGSIEFLTAELKYSIQTYEKVAKIDISHNTEALWQLHNGGSVEHRAAERYRRSRGNDPMPEIDGHVSSHPEITEYFEASGLECFQ